jgi:hypothetical protein
LLDEVDVGIIGASSTISVTPLFDAAALGRIGASSTTSATPLFDAVATGRLWHCPLFDAVATGRLWHCLTGRRASSGPWSMCFLLPPSATWAGLVTPGPDRFRGVK